MGIINLAHGSLFMIGAYVAFLVARHWGSLWLALPVGDRSAASLLGAAARARRCSATSTTASTSTRCC